MKISKLFHWLYAILMFLPFGLVVYNALASMWSGVIIQDFDTWISYIGTLSVTEGIGVIGQINGVYNYLLSNVFSFDLADLTSFYISFLLTYWTCISIIWLVFDVFMYVPLLVHRWIDKAKIE